MSITDESSSSLAADKLLNDPRLVLAKQLLLDAIAAAQADLTAPRSADPARTAIYQNQIELLAQQRGSHTWYPYLGSGIGNGPFVELLDGSVKYDLISGIGTHYLGHSHPTLTTAMFEAATSDLLMQGHLQQNADSVDLMELLTAASSLDHCFLTSSGAMANENALKIAFQKNAPAQRLIAFEHTFAGRTLALAQLTDKALYRQGLPQTLTVDYLPFYDNDDVEGSCAAAIRALDNILKRYPGQHAALWCEFVLGEGGFYPGSHNFFRPLIERAKQEGIAIIADEVQTCGRLSELFAYQHFGLADTIDIVTIGKLSQVCATLFRKNWNPRPGLLSQTFTTSTAAIRGSLAIFRELLNNGYFGPQGKIAILHSYFKNGLELIAMRHPGLLCGPYGIGAMIAFTPYDGSSEHTTRFLKALFDAGIIAFSTGSAPYRVRMLPPVGALQLTDVTSILTIIENTLLSNRPQQ
jgi:acetylornithine/N-succinyldiaminopimelate aminotransferase